MAALLGRRDNATTIYGNDFGNYSRDERTVILCDPDPGLIF